MKLIRGYIQVYTGDGKGKTTAAIGAAVRAAGAGLKVYFAQFMKNRDYNEIKALRRAGFRSSIAVKQFGAGCFVRKKNAPRKSPVYEKGLAAVVKAIKSGKYDLVVLDELNVAVYFGLLPLNEILSVFMQKPKHVEIIVTGRKAPKELVDMADLVTEMKQVRHYYNDGVKARKGVEC